MAGESDAKIITPQKIRQSLFSVISVWQPGLVKELTQPDYRHQPQIPDISRFAAKCVEHILEEGGTLQSSLSAQLIATVKTCLALAGKCPELTTSTQYIIWWTRHNHLIYNLMSTSQAFDIQFDEHITSVWYIIWWARHKRLIYNLKFNTP